jgi:hypothetical protein
LEHFRGTTVEQHLSDVQMPDLAEKQTIGGFKELGCGWIIGFSFSR